MEYLGGGSALELMKPGPFQEKDIAIILREILKGLEYLHSEKKLHRDIKGTSAYVPTSNSLPYSLAHYTLLPLPTVTPQPYYPVSISLASMMDML